MGDDTGQTDRYFYCLRHARVEPGDNRCPAKYLLGPYPDAEHAANAVASIHEREERLRAEDEAWTDGSDAGH